MPVLNPKQQSVLDELIEPNAPRPKFDEKLKHELTRALEDSISDIDVAADKEQVVISKAQLAQIHTCEGHFLAEEGAFSWNAASATGSVAHEAAALSFGMREDKPAADLVDIAIDRMSQEKRRGTPGEWLAEAPAEEIADLRIKAVDHVGKFLDIFPPLSNDMSPRFETSISAEVLDKGLKLSGRPDLKLFKPKGNEAGVLIIELKTGRMHPNHLDELRFYSLLETFYTGVPPYRAATFYLETGTWIPEDITVEKLHSAIRRTSEGIRKITEIRKGREATLSPGPTCNFCSARETCSRAEEGLTQLRDDLDI
jgi:hypothetical protein